MLFLPAFLAACQSPQQVEDRLALAFEETMFDRGGPAHDRQASDSREEFLSKWHSPVEVGIVEGATDANTALISKELEKLAALSRLEIRVLPAGSRPPPLAVFFSDQKDFVINSNQLVVCYSRIEANPDGSITRAEVHIAFAAEGKWRVECLVHELLHALGWRGHTHSIRSAISYMHGERDLTRWDEYLIRTLYDPRLQPGISKREAMPKVRAILHEMLAER